MLAHRALGLPGSSLPAIALPAALAALASACFPAKLPAQLPSSPVPAQKKARFIDFSADLMDKNVTVVLGKLERMKEGRKKKLDDKDAHLGTGNTVSRIAGTQFYKAPVKARLRVDCRLCGSRSGVKAGKHLMLAFDMQLARLPDGSYQRHVLGGSRATLEDGMFGLWVLAKARKGKVYEIRHVIPQPKKQEARGDMTPERAFDEDMEDFVAINKRIAALRKGVQSVRGKNGDEKDDRKDAKDPEEALRTLQEILDRKVVLKNIANDRLLRQHVGPWERRARELLKATAGDSGEGSRKH